MAIMPEATWQPLPENRTQPSIVPTQVILHTAVDGRAPETDLRRVFDSRNFNLESHFWVTNSGKIFQYMDTNRRADANSSANQRAISIETEDDGRPHSKPWTQAQIRSLVKIIRWASETHGIPIQRCEAWNTPGIGWHTMWNFPGDPEGQRARWVSSPWSRTRKTCPGPLRIGQFVNDILPKAIGAEPEPQPEPEPDPEPPNRRPILRIDDRGDHVRAVQQFIGLRADGRFGPITKAGVQGFQVSQGLVVDGVVGPNTWARIDTSKPAYKRTVSNYLPYTLRRNSRNARRSFFKNATVRWNTEMRLRAYTTFSTSTEAATLGFQKGCGLTADGIVGQVTWGTYFSGLK